LVSALDRAVAFVQVDDISVLVAEDLDFEVSGASDEFFEEDFIASEGVFRFALGLFEIACELVFGLHDAHTATTAPFGCFEHDGEFHFASRLGRFVEASDGRCGAFEDRHTDLFGDFAGGDFIAQQFEGFVARSYEHDSGVAQGSGKLGIFREEPVAGVHRIDFVFEAQFDDRWDIEVGANRFAWFADGVGFVGFESVQCESVFVRVDRYGTDPEFVGAAEDTDGDFAAVGSKDASDGKHRARG
jgi:hypothetical protein